jgi:DNA-binding cell septation regulator SpoVG
MPTRKDKAGEYQDIFFPGSKTVRDDLQAMVLEAYKNEVGKLVAA